MVGGFWYPLRGYNYDFLILLPNRVIIRAAKHVFTLTFMEVARVRRTNDQIARAAGPIAIYVRGRRKELGYTQVALADRAGVGLRFLRELELGKKNLRLDKVSQVLEFLGGEICVRDIGRAP